MDALAAQVSGFVEAAGLVGPARPCDGRHHLENGSLRRRALGRQVETGPLAQVEPAEPEYPHGHTHEKLASGRANDWPYQGVASSPVVEGNKLYYVSNRAVLWCIDIKGSNPSKTCSRPTSSPNWTAGFRRAARRSDGERVRELHRDSTATPRGAPGSACSRS